MPPYDGRSTGSDELKGTVERQYGDAEGGGAGQTASPAEESPVGEHEVTHETPDSPHGVGESTARRGEDMAEADGKEAGRTDTGTEHKSERPTGTSDARRDRRGPAGFALTVPLVSDVLTDTAQRDHIARRVDGRLGARVDPANRPIGPHDAELLVGGPTALD